MVYEPREDSFLLQEKLLEHFKNKKVGVSVDIGTGTGFIAQALSAFSEKVFACDVDEQAVNEAKQNLDAANASNVTVFNSDLFSGFPESLKGKCDLIVFNPPYLPLGEDDYKDNSLHGGKSGVDITIRFLEQSKKYLSNDGIIFFVASSTSDIDLLEKSLKKHKYQFRVIGKKHFFFEDILIYNAMPQNAFD